MAIGWQGIILGELNPLEAIKAVPVCTVQVGGLQIPISNHMVMVAVATLLLILVIPPVVRHPGLVPRGIPNLVESVCVFLRDEMARPVLGGHTDKYVVYPWTVFFFVLVLNLLGMVPTEKILALATGKPNHIGGPATANIWVTGALGIVTFVAMNVYGMREQGVVRYWLHLAPPVPAWVLPLLYPLELLSMCLRPFTLAIRLFANIVAGHMVLATILGLILVFKSVGVAAASVLGSVALSFLELLVAFIQAYIFAFLSTLYIGMAVHPEH